MGSDPGIGDVRQERSQSRDPSTLDHHFGTHDTLMPMWIAEPSVEPPPEVMETLRARAATSWYGYEIRPETATEIFWDWMLSRHRWDGSGLHTVVSPSVGTSIGVLIEQLTEPGDGVIIQPPVFTDFKTLIASSRRTPVPNALVLTDGAYRIDFDDLAIKAADPANRMLILCSPHNPVGRVWRGDELTQLVSICADNNVFVLADEIHADLVIPPHEFVPFAAAVRADDQIEWAATHGPTKTFGLAGVCDTLIVTDRATIAERFASVSSQFHLTRNNVFSLTAFEAAYRHGGAWLDDFLNLISLNVEVLANRLPDGIRLVRPEGTYLAWLDLRDLGLEVPDIPRWLASSAGLALSPGHWFGRQGAGFARMSIAAQTDTVERAAAQLAAAVDG